MAAKKSIFGRFPKILMSIVQALIRNSKFCASILSTITIVTTYKNMRKIRSFLREEIGFWWSKMAENRQSQTSGPLELLGNSRYPNETWHVDSPRWVLQHLLLRLRGQRSRSGVKGQLSAFFGLKIDKIGSKSVAIHSNRMKLHRFIELD